MISIIHVLEQERENLVKENIKIYEQLQMMEYVVQKRKDIYNKNLEKIEQLDTLIKGTY